MTIDPDHRPDPTSRPVDLMILECLAQGRHVRADELARILGADRVRVNEWLARFSRQGLCRARTRTRDGVHETTFRGDRGLIAAYIKARRDTYNL